ncbi:MAG TPA: beta-ketoacyl-ACP reductase [Bacillota bacterium]
MRVQDKVAIVTGAGSGIGRAIALRLAAEGARVVAADINEDGARETVAQIEQAGGRALAVRCNVADTAEARDLVEHTASTWGTVDILVNNAGITRDAILPKMTEAMWDAVLDVNLKSLYNCTRPALRYMKAQRSGRIVSISSRAYMGNYGQANYASTKGGVVGFTRALALEVGPYGINVNAIAPGYIDTPMTQGTVGDRIEQYMLTSALRMIGQPRHIADVVVFLCSPEADYITGQTLSVCGGRSIGQQVF